MAHAVGIHRPGTHQQTPFQMFARYTDASQCIINQTTNACCARTFREQTVFIPIRHLRAQMVMKPRVLRAAWTIRDNILQKTHLHRQRVRTITGTKQLMPAPSFTMVPVRHVQTDARLDMAL